jgi:anti-sigma factor RsiW
MNGKQDRLQRYFDGELPESERAAFEAELTDDDRVRLQVMAEMRAALGNALAADSAEIDVTAAVGKQLRGTVTPIGWAARLRRGTVLGTSAGLLLAAAAAFMLVLQPWHSRLSDNCDVETLEVDGAQAAVFQIQHNGDSPTTVIWTPEED